MPVPLAPKIYHLVHIDRLPSILAAGHLWSDAVMTARAPQGTNIGMNKIKQNRLQFGVKCWPPDKVGEYVPFYFCSRSVMLYVIHRANHPELTYRGGQGPIVHLEADLHTVVQAADNANVRWAISLSNAGSAYAQFRTGLTALEDVGWDAVAARDFQPADIQERKQAEFLIKRSLPWPLIERIGVGSPQVAQQVANMLHNAGHRPPVEIRYDWYY